MGDSGSKRESGSARHFKLLTSIRLEIHPQVCLPGCYCSGWGLRRSYCCTVNLYFEKLFTLMIDSRFLRWILGYNDGF